MLISNAQEKSRIISINIDNLSFRDSVDKVRDWGLKGRSGFVCFANVHMIIEAYQDYRLKEDLQKAFLVLPDGKPLSVACELLYNKKQERVAGMDFMPALFEEISSNNAKVFLFGSTPEVLQLLVAKIKIEYPGAEVVGTISPPFRQITEVETQEYLRKINDSNANFILVALGCPKQERWMAQHSNQVNGLMLGLGGAFPVFAGIHKRCPKWMRDNGFEWLYRLMLEPKRLFRRYCVTNLKFLYLFSRQLMRPTHPQTESLG